MRYSLAGTVVKSCPNWHKTAFKFQRIRCTTCLTSPDNQKEENHTCKTCTCLIPFSCTVVTWLQKLLRRRRFLNVQHGFALWSMHFPEDLKGQPERQDISEKAQNGKASCCTLRKRITKLKCVNSEVKSVDIDPNWGCLNWPYGTMSESP